MNDNNSKTANGDFGDVARSRLAEATARQGSTVHKEVMKPVLVLVAVAALAAGCAHINYTDGDRYDRGLVICLSGAGGMMGETDRIREGLAGGGVSRALEVFEWSRGEVFSDQTAVKENRHKAGQLARRIEAYQREYPGRPVHLIGVSAGTGVAIWALEALSDAHRVTGVILIASSLDTRYDLTKALEKVDDAVYSFSSVADTVLSLGVPWAGTVDRSGGLGGGLVGFSPPDGSSEHTKMLYKEKLVQINWWPGDMVLGHLGDHLGAANPTFVRVRIAPLILGKQGAEKPKGPEEGGSAPAAPAAAPTPKTAAKKRFVEWKIAEKRPGDTSFRKPAAESEASDAKNGPAKGGDEPQRPVDESQFFNEPRKLP